MMARGWILVIALFLLLLCGCGGETAIRMEHPEDPQGRYREQIEIARRVLQQNETWADRAEWEVSKSSDGWTVTAWRIEQPDQKGPNRYVPWGYSVIELDHRMVAIHYQPHG